MTDRNDRLLLALGWRRADKDDVETPFDAVGDWINPDGAWLFEADIPRPYDNLQDAVDCVPEGLFWDLCVVTAGAEACLTIPGAGFLSHLGDTEIFARADSPAEALSEAILKAMEEGK